MFIYIYIYTYVCALRSTFKTIEHHIPNRIKMLIKSYQNDTIAKGHETALTLLRSQVSLQVTSTKIFRCSSSSKKLQTTQGLIIWKTLSIQPNAKSQKNGTFDKIGGSWNCWPNANNLEKR